MKSLPWIIALSLATQAFAELSMPKVFSDHMVLQTDKPVKLWGKADPNAKITAQFGETKAAAQSNAEGSWSLALPAMKVNAKGDELQVTSGNDKLIFKDVLVGEVWHASGQSNMQWSLRQIGDQGQAAVAASDVPTIRFFQATKVTGVTPQEDVEGT